MLTVGSLFTGIGGLDLGLERAGMRVLWQCESDLFCRRVLYRHWPEVEVYEDIRELTNPPNVDVLCGGFPCQDISRVGRRAGLAGPQSGLWFHFARLIRRLQPSYVLVENTETLRSRGRLGRVLGDLAEIGYDAEWDCLSAAGVGAPHIRDRLFVLAYPGSRRSRASEEAVFAGRKSPELCPWWADEPALDRVAHGIPSELDRHRRRVIGNAVVPQLAEWIGRRIVIAHNQEAAGV